MTQYSTSAYAMEHASSQSQHPLSLQQIDQNQPLLTQTKNSKNSNLFSQQSDQSSSSSSCEIDFASTHFRDQNTPAPQNQSRSGSQFTTSSRRQTEAAMQEYCESLKLALQSTIKENEELRKKLREANAQMVKKDRYIQQCKDAIVELVQKHEVRYKYDTQTLLALQRNGSFRFEEEVDEEEEDEEQF